MVVRPSSFHTHLLSSITSTELRKIVFPTNSMYDGTVFARRMGEWRLIDKQLCWLVDQLRTTGHRYTLEVQLRLTKVGDDPGKYDFTRFLPEFREAGIVTIIDTVNGDRIIHSSTP